MRKEQSMNNLGRARINNKRCYKLKKRLKFTEEWLEEFLNFEEHKTISKKALKTFYQNKPIWGTILNILYLPTIAMSFISDFIWWNRYYKRCKEVKIIKKRLKSYE